jgi:hypothetical protein
MTTVDISIALCIDLTAERVASLGTTINGPQRLRQRGWEDWWGWDRPLSALHASFFELSASLQEDAIVGWYSSRLEWLADSGLLLRRRKS